MATSKYTRWAILLALCGLARATSSHQVRQRRLACARKRDNAGRVRVDAHPTIVSLSHDDTPGHSPSRPTCRVGLSTQPPSPPPEPCFACASGPFTLARVQTLRVKKIKSTRPRPRRGLQPGASSGFFFFPRSHFFIQHDQRTKTQEMLTTLDEIKQV